MSAGQSGLACPGTDLHNGLAGAWRSTGTMTLWVVRSNQGGGGVCLYLICRPWPRLGSHDLVVVAPGIEPLRRGASGRGLNWTAGGASCRDCMDRCVRLGSSDQIRSWTWRATADRPWTDPPGGCFMCIEAHVP